MTTTQLMIEFNRLAESVYKIYSTADRLNPYDIEGYLNKAQNQYLKEKFLSYQSPYEIVYALNKSYDEISELIKVDTDLTPTDAESGYGDHAKKIDTLPDDYLYYVRSSVNMDREKLQKVTGEWAENRIIGLDSLIKTISGVGNWPIILNPLVYLVDQAIYIIHDAYTTINSFNLMYLKQPRELDLQTGNECELPLHWHYDIADYAVRLYLSRQKEEIQKEQEE
ncbi:hypothetical protein [Methanohalobium sp.]|uniref:hypothetical protein n=1 Tax=Methanohalobium sp. TaxID=2837493 RepID=UPI0025FD6924|nr:hypothetical protein [Methanohalobium sp.]